LVYPNLQTIRSLASTPRPLFSQRGLVSTIGLWFSKWSLPGFSRQTTQLGTIFVLGAHWSFHRFLKYRYRHKLPVTPGVCPCLLFRFDHVASGPLSKRKSFHSGGGLRLFTRAVFFFFFFRRDNGRLSNQPFFRSRGMSLPFGSS